MSTERWSFQLAPYLTGKAQQAYAALPPDEAKTYSTVKEAILRRYDIHEETYRQRFRKLRPKGGESPQELITRLKDLATRWARESKSRDELLDLIVREQFLAILPEDARVAVIERQPKDCEEAGRVASNFFAAPCPLAKAERKTALQPMSAQGAETTGTEPETARRRSLEDRAAMSDLQATSGKPPGVLARKAGTIRR